MENDNEPKAAANDSMRASFLDLIALRKSIMDAEQTLENIRAAYPTDDPEQLVARDVAAAHYIRERERMVERYMKWVEEYVDTYQMLTPALKDTDRFWMDK